MKYLIDYNNEAKGGGSWTSYCPICGLHFAINFDYFFLYIIKDYEKFYKYKLDSEKKKLWKENKDKIISNYHKFKKIEKYTFSEYNDITLLLPNSIVKHGVEYHDSTEFLVKQKITVKFTLITHHIMIMVLKVYQCIQNVGI